MAQATKFADRDRFARLWAAGVGTETIADIFGASARGVSQAAKRFGLPARTPGFRAGKPVPRDDDDDDTKLNEALGRLAKAYGRGRVTAPEGWSFARDQAVLMSRGRYAQLRELAGDWCVPMGRVMARWHIVRRL